MTRSEIEAQLKTIIKPYVQNEEAFENLSQETDMLQDLQINSAHLVDIILDMEEHFDIEIDDETAEKMLTVGEAVTATENLLDKKD
ncbi:acyl carrier protein [Owenweeksia hongkongensis]|uniref:acyl carrier protein n=1 Tax=Owenweeksia hongkongensis TaxID=253245 RepID=UPI003A93D50A